ncbi:hypothetical protein [Duganella vulcania]|uniref:Uncharacterized protein n=1 Tax=Duganella vulcania TaxID=2692166 RepID=A0A845GCN6_9BURK|nr:hypothetical protein [Duganella vulcania]MYM92373.1 hypothetical protein [Duganella vulcania]
MGHLSDFANLVFVWLCVGAVQVVSAFWFARLRGRGGSMRRALLTLLTSALFIAFSLSMLWFPLVAAPCLLLSGWLTFASMALSMSAVQTGFAESGYAALSLDVPPARHGSNDREHGEAATNDSQAASH